MPGAFDYEEIQEVLRDGTVRPRWRRKSKAADSSSPGQEPGSAGNGRPIIVINNRHLYQIADDAWRVLHDSNRPPWLFRHGDRFAKIGRNDKGRPIILHLGVAGLRGWLDRLATWASAKSQDRIEPARPPKDVVEDLLALDNTLPVLRGLIGTPVFASDGALVSSPGYHESTGLYYEPLGDPIPHVVREPTKADVDRAKGLIIGEWLGEFPFVDESSRAHAIAAALTGVVREMIAGPTPLFALDAPAPGTGKGFLAQSIGVILFGIDPAVMTEGRGEEENRKRITAVLRDGGPVILLDNIKHPLDSGALAAVLTTMEWSDRVLGKSETIRLPNRSLWLVTGNNIVLDGEIARRSAWVRLDALIDRPWERTGFKHDPFIAWVHEVRHELVWALLVLVQHWLALGKPLWQGRPLGSFEDWSRVVGGVLETADIGGFLGNREELYRRLDTETEEWRDVVACWWDKFGDAAMKTGELYDLVREWELLPSVFARAKDDATDRSLRTKFGTALAKRRDRRYGKYFIRKVGRDGHQKGPLYRLEPAGGDEDGLGAEPPPLEPRPPAEVPHNDESNSDSLAEPAGPSGPVFHAEADFGVALGEVEAMPKEVPHVPHVLQPDSNGRVLDPEPWRDLDDSSAEVPRAVEDGRAPCRGGCGRRVQRGQKCSDCADAAVVEWKTRQEKQGIVP